MTGFRGAKKEVTGGQKSFTKNEVRGIKVGGESQSMFAKQEVGKGLLQGFKRKI